jgi:hypothetical protein
MVGLKQYGYGYFFESHPTALATLEVAPVLPVQPGA